MDATNLDILDLVQEEDVKFIRLAYCDLFGVQKNMAIMSSQLRRAFEEGIAFDGSAVKGFGTPERSDLFLVPDGSTASLLPWRPAHERVMRLCCNVRNPEAILRVTAAIFSKRLFSAVQIWDTSAILAQNVNSICSAQMRREIPP